MVARSALARKRSPEDALARVRRRLDRFVHHPATELAIVLMIVASVALVVLESVYQLEHPAYELVELAGHVITGLFIAELAVRFWVARKKRRFFRRYWVDIIAVIPLARSLRLFRILRLLRLFRAGALINRRITLFRGVFHGALGELTLLGTLTVVLVLVATVVLYLVEHDNAPFTEVGGTLWYSVYSLVAGEPVGGAPATGLGRAITLGLMFGGMTIFGIFVGTISASMVSRLSKRTDVQELDIDELSDHVVVCGWNASGPLVLQELFGRAEHGAERRGVVLITEGEQMPTNIPPDVVRRHLLYHVSGDYTRVEVLERANIAGASAAIVLADSLAPRSDQDRVARTVLAALTIERLRPGIFTCAELRSRENGSLLKMAGVDEIVVPEEYSGVILGSVSRNRGLVRVFDEILTSQYGNSFHKVVLPDAWAGRTVRALFGELKEKHDAVLVSIETVRDGKRAALTVNPPLEAVLEPGAVAVVIASRPVQL